ncbi:MAG: hypothetical protein ACK5W5_02310, partial [Cyanobacteriota bacterium]
MSPGRPGSLEANLALVLNAGSSTLKARLLDPDGLVLWKGQTAWQAGLSAGEASAADAVLQA